jgi:hypothetical protein
MSGVQDIEAAVREYDPQSSLLPVAYGYTGFFLSEQF